MTGLINAIGRGTGESRHVRLYHRVMSASSQSLRFGNLAPLPQHIGRLRTAAMPTLTDVVMMLGMALRCGGAVS